MSSAAVQPHPSAQRISGRQAETWRGIGVCGFLILAVLLVFGRTLSHGFLNYDDCLFVYDQPHVSAGFSWSGFVWAFTAGPAGEWYPLTMVSHMLDCQAYALRPAGHHLTNVLLHAATAVTLFLVLWRMTGALWPAALVAALFALHPLRVESVAWVSERRDVLSGLFFMLTLGAYGEYVRHPRSLARYLAMVGLFALGLLAKPIVVTLPPLLWLLDFWPLERFGGIAPRAARPPAAFPWRIVVEKLPLLALAIAVAVMTMVTHVVPPSTRLTLPERLANAAVSCLAYLGQLFVPVGLSIFYSHPEAGRPAWQVAAAVVLVLAITAAVVICRRSYPYFFVGWFWYVGMLVLVLGLTYVGPHARADRYTYLAQIGLDIALIWGAMRLGASWPARRWVFGIGSGLVLAALMVCTWRQTGLWQDDKTLWEHALACDPKNATAHYILGTAFEKTSPAAAAAEYRLAVKLAPNERNLYNVVRAKAQSALGTIALEKGDVADAVAHYQLALQSFADFVPVHLNLANLLANRGDFDEALVHYRRAMELEPDSAGTAYRNFALALAHHGRNREAIKNFRQALTADPKLGIAHVKLAVLLAQQGDVDEAIAHFGRAIEIDPFVAFPFYQDVAFPYDQLARLLRGQGKMNEAGKFHERGLKTIRRFAETQNLHGVALAQQGKLEPAIARFQIALVLAPDLVQAHNNLADALALQAKTDEAIAHYRRALEIDPNSRRQKRASNNYQIIEAHRGIALCRRDNHLA